VWGWGEGVAAAAVTPYTGAAAAVPHSGSDLPLWPTAGALTAVAHGGRLPRAPLRVADRWRPPYCRGSWRLHCKPP
jgi:hypothetical protein